LASILVIMPIFSIYLFPFAGKTSACGDIGSNTIIAFAPYDIPDKGWSTNPQNLNDLLRNIFLCLICG
jgi:hypothetical protein